VFKDATGDNSLIPRRGLVPRNAVVKIARTFRTGTNDNDALDFARMYLDDQTQCHANLHEFEDL